jgi:NTE family protein
MDILINQTRALRKRQLITNYKNPEAPNGAYWGITTEIDKYKLDGAMVRDNTITRGLQSIRTRLDSFTPEEQGRLINWGYALADTAMRRHVIETPMTPGKWPVEKYRLDK